MKAEYDLARMKSCPNPYAKQLKQQVTFNFRLANVEYLRFDQLEAKDIHPAQL